MADNLICRVPSSGASVRRGRVERAGSRDTVWMVMNRSLRSQVVAVAMRFAYQLFIDQFE